MWIVLLVAGIVGLGVVRTARGRDVKLNLNCEAENCQVKISDRKLFLKLVNHFSPYTFSETGVLKAKDLREVEISITPKRPEGAMVFADKNGVIYKAYHYTIGQEKLKIELYYSKPWLEVKIGRASCRERV